MTTKTAHKTASQSRPDDKSARQRKAPPTPHASRLYGSLTWVYEAFWTLAARGNIEREVRKYPIAAGERVLEVGVGTGFSFVSYPADASITGVDLSEEMLEKARQRIDEFGWSHIEVMPMNAEQLDFPDASFDVVTSFHVVSVVSDPQQMMRELTRVCKTGGRILLINHFRSRTPWIAKIVDSAGAITKHLGWRTDLSLDDAVAGLPLRIDKIYKPKRRSVFTVIWATKTDT